MAPVVLKMEKEREKATPWMTYIHFTRSGPPTFAAVDLINFQVMKLWQSSLWSNIEAARHELDIANNFTPSSGSTFIAFEINPMKPQETHKRQNSHVTHFAFARRSARHKPGPGRCFNMASLND